MRKTLLIWSLALLCTFFGSTLGTLAQSRSLKILTEPDGVDVYLLNSTQRGQGIFLGRSDTLLHLEERYLRGRGSLDFRLEKDGFFPLQHNFKTLALLDGAELPQTGPLRLPAQKEGHVGLVLGILLGGSTLGSVLLVARRKKTTHLEVPSSPSSVFEGELDPLLGREVCGFRVERVITRGGMGVLYLAQSVNGKKEKAAVKVVDLLAHSDEMQQRFFRELAVAAKLHHPSIVKTWDYQVIEARFLAIVMEWLPGADLEARMKGQKLSAAQSVLVLRPIFEALAYLHERHIVHRDVKPANIFVLPNGVCKLIDFGLARDESQVGLTGTGIFMGTAQYAAPEQIRSQGANPAADQYALGLVLYALLTGSPAFDSGTAIQILSNQMLKVPPPVTEFNPTIPHDFALAVAKMIEKSPQDRFPSVLEALARLEETA